MRSLKQLLSYVLMSLIAGSFAFASGYEAKVVKVTGDARVQLPGQSASVAVTEGMSLPQGAVITTGTGEVWLTGFPGATAAVRMNSSMRLAELGNSEDGKRKALLELSRGKVSSTLDPTKSGVTNYSVRTPKGVAAARGTVLDVSYETNARTGSDEMTVVSLSGVVTVTLINSSGNTVTISLPVGNVVTTGGGSATTDAAPAAITLAQAVASGVVSAQDLKEVVQFVAAAVSSPTSGYSTEAGQTLVQTVVAAAVTAVGSTSTTATDIIGSALSAVGSNNSSMQNAVKSGATSAGATTDQINSATNQANTPSGTPGTQTDGEKKGDTKGGNSDQTTPSNDVINNLPTSPAGNG